MASVLDHLAEREPVTFDPKEYLARTLPRQSGDILKVIPMHGRDSFRVNWCSSKASQQGAMPGLNFAYIRESKFLFCRLNSQGSPEITYPAKQ